MYKASDGYFGLSFSPAWYPVKNSNTSKGFALIPYLIMIKWQNTDWVLMSDSSFFSTDRRDILAKCYVYEGSLFSFETFAYGGPVQHIR